MRFVIIAIARERVSERANTRKPFCAFVAATFVLRFVYLFIFIFIFGLRLSCHSAIGIEK